MKLFYNPAFLCKVLRLHEGLRSCEKDYGARFVDYYAAMKKFIEKNPGNVFAV